MVALLKVFKRIDEMTLWDEYDSISLSGCGMLNFYQVGVYKALFELGIPPHIQFAGASAGACMSVLMAQRTLPEEIAQVAIDILRPYQGRNLITNPKILFRFADQFLGHFVTESTLPKIIGKVGVSITLVRGLKNILVDDFTDQNDLDSAIRASCHLPSTKYPYTKFRNRRVIDGGFSNNCPKLSPNCLRISPIVLDRRKQIRPSKTIAPWWGIVVPSSSKAFDMFELGYRDMMKIVKYQ
jgi:hypothetical protein